jgi:hypothetical protein
MISRAEPPTASSTAVAVRPRAGDVVVQAMDDSPFLYGLGVFPCALQQSCGTYEQAARHGMSLAHRFGVDLWSEEPDGRFTKLAGYRLS